VFSPRLTWSLAWAVHFRSCNLARLLTLLAYQPACCQQTEVMLTVSEQAAVCLGNAASHCCCQQRCFLQCMSLPGTWAGPPPTITYVCGAQLAVVNVCAAL
jgi:hypothetical protein